FARNARAPENRNWSAGSTQPDAAAEERDEVGLRGSETHTRTETEVADVLEKEVTLFRKEETEARQVDLLLIHFHLREVRPIGGIECDGRREAVLQIDAAVVAVRLSQGLECLEPAIRGPRLEHAGSNEGFDF